ncbi:hypothetical protein T484DRAFT_1784090 [Baffinella frigidus]|nr:hypothetical protein T484DRAFT_1784090 [Cryptophyta sp. CCMP2293]
MLPRALCPTDSALWERSSAKRLSTRLACRGIGANGRLISGSVDGTIRVWSAAQPTCEAVLQERPKSCRDTTFR